MARDRVDNRASCSCISVAKIRSVADREPTKKLCQSHSCCTPLVLMVSRSRWLPSLSIRSDDLYVMLVTRHRHDIDSNEELDTSGIMISCQNAPQELGDSGSFLDATTLLYI